MVPHHHLIQLADRGHGDTAIPDDHLIQRAKHRRYHQLHPFKIEKRFLRNTPVVRPFPPIILAYDPIRDEFLLDLVPGIRSESTQDGEQHGSSRFYTGAVRLAALSISNLRIESAPPAKRLNSEAEASPLTVRATKRGRM